MKYAVCCECGVFMNCDEIDAAYVPEQDEWTCGPCVRDKRLDDNDTDFWEAYSGRTHGDVG